ncbi:MAG: folate-binding protein YgfZ [Hyphomonadaceae bacterium]|nr:folate-binding protein YgfZ [Hyphomonadaceae bacterium]MBP9234495.1 folate-binding protein YgfZ [Hyphomonadaceae bacterium]
MQTPEFLDYRSIVSVTGADAEAFLNGIVTVSTTSMAPHELRYGALLTPQGKVIADMLLARASDAILLDVAASAAPALVKRLTLMKLRAAVTVGERPDLGVSVFEGEADPRSGQAPRRKIGPRGQPGDVSVYDAARIAAGLAEQNFDFGAEDVFPADINMDLVGGIDFRKGCFVGQEVVSRMKRRGTARRRTLKVTLAAGVTAPTPILANGFEIGMLTSISGGAGLARVRIDRLSQALAKGEPLTAGRTTVTFDRPSWLAAELAALEG